MSKKMSNLEELFRVELAALLADERHLLEALPLFRAAAGNQVLAELLTRVESDATRLFESGATAVSKPDTNSRRAVRGIIEEGQRRIKNIVDANLVDVELVTILQRLLGYQIATHRSLLPLARVLGQSDVILFCETALESKLSASDQLSGVALHQIYWRAAWWSPEDAGAWERVKTLLRDDWQRTKEHLGMSGGDESSRESFDTDSLPGDPAFRYGFTTGLHYRDREWDEDTRTYLSSRYGGLWDDRAEQMIERGFRYSRRGEPVRQA